MILSSQEISQKTRIVALLFLTVLFLGCTDTENTDLQNSSAIVTIETTTNESEKISIWGTSEQNAPEDGFGKEEEVKKMRISIQAKENTIVFELNDGQAAKDLYEQLPLTVDVEDYSDNEKIFYPPTKLDTTDAPLANAKSGTLAYYAPWGDVVMFYDDFGSASGLYELGHAVSGSEHIQNISGTILITKV